jgi:hypothetical protein
MKADSTWIKITNQVPPKFVTVWGCDASGRQGFCQNIGIYMKFNDELYPATITHWMFYERPEDPPHSERMYIAQNISVSALIEDDELKRKCQNLCGTSCSC